MNNKSQKVLLEKLLSSPDAFTRCISIMQPHYFDKELQKSVKFLITHYSKYNKLPDLDYFNAEFDLDFKPKVVTTGDVKFICDEIQSFCQTEALYSAISDCSPIIANGEKERFPEVLKRVQDALAISISHHLGLDMFENTVEILRSLLETHVYEKTGIRGIDDIIQGLARKQVTLFSANSGGGKSIMLSNLAVNLSRAGKNVVIFSLELAEEMIFLRNVAIMTGIDTKDWKDNIDYAANLIRQMKIDGAGSITVVRLPNKANTNAMKSYLKFYEMEKGYTPDVIVIDYLDLMSGNAEIASMSISEKDKEKAEDVAELAHAYNAIVITASQQNRGSIREGQPDQASIAGGLTKVNTVDNYISIYMNPDMRIKGEMLIFFLKTRSSDGVGKSSALHFNAHNLIISDSSASSLSTISQVKKRLKANLESGTFTLPGLESNMIEEMPEEVRSLISFDSEERTPTPEIDSMSTTIQTDDENLPWRTDDGDEGVTEYVAPPKPPTKKSSKLKSSGLSKKLDKLMETM